MTVTGDCPAFIAGQRAVVSRFRTAGLVWLCLVVFFCLAGAVSLAKETAPTNAPEKFANSDCLDCHLDPNTTRVVNGKTESLVFPTKAFAHSVHADLACVNCHTGIKQLPHDSPLPPPECARCHQEESKIYATSIHGVSHMLGSPGAAECWDCHGSHDVLPVNNPASRVFKMNLPFTCAKCHSNPGLTREYEIRHPNAAKEYVDSMHGQALIKMGLIVAPSCDDCHGVHDIKRDVDTGSPISHANIAKTCGKCHLGIEQTYDRSIHGQLLTQGDARVPVCTDCHTAHQIVNPAITTFKEVMDERCGNCHPNHYQYYRGTYHGQAMALNSPNVAPKVAACYDCHGYHDILPRSDPRSHLSKTNILATCRQCHRDATIGFTEYDPHANPLDGRQYPLLHALFLGMTGLLIGTFAFFGLHTLGWLVRAAYLYLHDSKTFREAKIQTQVDDEWFTRFLPFERFLHLLVVSSFLLLVITGMPLKFSYTHWARVMFDIIGGPGSARTLHRFGALVTFLYFSLHLVSLTKKAWRGRKSLRDPATGGVRWKRLWHALFGPDSMVPTLQDWRDFVAHNKWFFGRGPKPQFDRWTYWEKFDYLAVFWGVAFIGASGLIMWFPMFFTGFLPGWVINIALLIHSDEALLAAGFIFAIHFFNTHFRIEKFPMDTVIFSGRVSKNGMLHERKRWYDRLVAGGNLDEYRVKDGWEGWKNIARSFGYFFFGLGVILLILIIYAMATRLTH
jgi:cytochrome b subunit of formate dehydrogenase